MRLTLFAYSLGGCQRALSVMSAFGDWEIEAYAPARMAHAPFRPIPQPSEAFYGEQFRHSDALIFLSACGIAVRSIAPHLKNKTEDPAVICLDEMGRYVIPLLSGHIGGANALAQRLAAALGATAVITTATDIHQRFSVDSWAVRENLQISSMQTAKAISAAILEGDLPFCSDFPIRGSLPAGLYEGSSGALGICVSYRLQAPFAETLRLIPRVLHLGVGCRRGISSSAILAAICQLFEKEGLELRSIAHLASIDLKADEEGLLELSEEKQWPISFYSAGELSKLPGSFSSSDFVQKQTGVDNVCERAASMEADHLIVRKSAFNGVTVAVAAENWEVRF